MDLTLYPSHQQVYSVPSPSVLMCIYWHRHEKAEPRTEPTNGLAEGLKKKKKRAKSSGNPFGNEPICWEVSRRLFCHIQKRQIRCDIKSTSGFHRVTSLEHEAGARRVRVFKSQTAPHRGISTIAASVSLHVSSQLRPGRSSSSSPQRAPRDAKNTAFS